MSGQAQAKRLSKKQLSELCDEREHKFRQSVISDIQEKRDKIEGFPPDDPTRPYGIPKELDLAAFDIWEHVLSYVTEPDEVSMLWEMSDAFRELLKRKYIETKLPEVQ